MENITFYIDSKQFTYIEGTIYLVKESSSGIENIRIGKIHYFLRLLFKELIVLNNIKNSKIEEEVGSFIPKDLLTSVIKSLIDSLGDYKRRYFKCTDTYCVEFCPFKSPYRIGSAGCQQCSDNVMYHTGQNWIICKKLNDHENLRVE